MVDLKTVRLLERLGEKVMLPLFLRPPRDRFRRYAEDPIEALRLFLSSYAFERQGAAPFYKDRALEALDNVSKDDTLCARGFSRKLWRKFCELVPAGSGTADKVNPLWPERRGHKLDVVAVACSKQLAQDDHHNLHRLATRSLASDQLKSAHDTLKGIRGVGPKIASLFLRDVAMDKKLENRCSRDRELLQPIDIWLRRIVGQLVGREFKDTEDAAAARSIVQLSGRAECSAVFLNAGSWYFGSQIVRAEERVNEALKSPESIRCAIDKHRERRCDESQKLSAVLGS